MHNVAASSFPPVGYNYYKAVETKEPGTVETKKVALVQDTTGVLPDMIIRRRPSSGNLGYRTVLDTQRRFIQPDRMITETEFSAEKIVSFNAANLRLNQTLP